MAKIKKVPHPQAAAHIKALRKEHGITQEKLAEMIGKSEQIVRMYEKGTQAIPQNTIKDLADIFNVIPEYIEGITECTTRMQYAIELEKQADGGASAYWDQVEQEQNKLRALFDVCGYGYEYDVRAQTIIDFAPVATNKPADIPAGPYKLTPKTTGQPCWLSQKAFEELIDRLKYTVSFACFEQEQKGTNA